MKFNKFTILIILFIGLTSYSTISYCAEGKKMELSMNEFKALGVAYNNPEIQKILAHDYYLNVEEFDKYILVSFVLNNKPKGFRGATSGFPEPILEIEKNTFEIKKIHYGR